MYEEEIRHAKISGQKGRRERMNLLDDEAISTGVDKTQ